MSRDAETTGRGIDGRMSLIEHLEELRRRLFYTVGLLLVCTVCLFSLAPQLFDYLRLPLQDIADQELIELQLLSPLEMFVTYLKLAVFSALFISAPWILAQIWLFVSPGLYKHEKRWIIPFVVLGSIFFVSGGAFAYFVVMPMGFEYLVKLTPDVVTNAWSVEKYFSIVLRLILAFAVVFEVPLLMWILSAAGIVAPSTYSRYRKYSIVVAVIVGAFLTPPDPFTQLMMAVPLVVFYELGIIGAKMLYRKPDQT
ncbi:MAG: twin-arginine translocase subunit TatC [Myxococcota bacterium]